MGSNEEAFHVSELDKVCSSLRTPRIGRRCYSDTMPRASAPTEVKFCCCLPVWTVLPADKCIASVHSSIDKFESEQIQIQTKSPVDQLAMAGLQARCLLATVGDHDEQIQIQIRLR